MSISKSENILEALLALLQSIDGVEEAEAIKFISLNITLEYHSNTSI